MISRKRLLQIIFLFIFCRIYSQKQTVDQSQEKFTQRIEWHADNEAFEYKVELVQNGSKNEPEFFLTEENFIEFSKPAGLYRYRVHVYDFLGRESTVTQWQNLEIKKAVKAMIAKMPENLVITPGQKKTVFTIGAEGIEKKSIVLLINNDDESVLVPDKKEFKNNKINLTMLNLRPGNYRIRIINPSGLETDSEQLLSVTERNPKKEKLLAQEELEKQKKEKLAAQKAEKEKLAEEKRLAKEKKAEERKNAPAKDIILLGGADLSISLYDGKLFEMTDTTVAFGAQTKVLWYPFELEKNSKLGFESGIWYSRLQDKNQYYTASLTDLELRFNAVYRRPLYDKWLFWQAKAGLGLTDIYKSVEYAISERESSSKNYVYVSIQGGASLLALPAKHFAAEAGVELVHKTITGMPTGVLTPYLCVGLRW